MRMSSAPPDRWYAGKEYDTDVANAKSILANLSRYYPMAVEGGYEIAGFVWWQGERDRHDAGHAEAYESNLVQFIESIRASFDAPRAKFVMATVGFDGYNMTGNTRKIFDAQMAVSDGGGPEGEYPQFRGNADIHASYRGGGYHYGNDADTYMEVGNAMGLAMAKLLFARNSSSLRG